MAQTPISEDEKIKEYQKKYQKNSSELVRKEREKRKQKLETEREKLAWDLKQAEKHVSLFKFDKFGQGKKSFSRTGKGPGFSRTGGKVSFSRNVIHPARHCKVCGRILNSHNKSGFCNAHLHNLANPTYAKYQVQLQGRKIENFRGGKVSHRKSLLNYNLFNDTYIRRLG